MSAAVKGEEMIYIIRHGQTEMNNRKALQGRSDLPLNGIGLAQAEETGLKFMKSGIRFDHVFTSPLVRAVKTAELIAPDVEPRVDERLIEMDYGPYEGTDLTNLPPEILVFFSDFVNNPAPPGMEPLASVVSRAGAFLEDLRGLSGNILISTHAIAMKGLLEYLTPGSNGAYWSKYVGNCGIYTVINENGEYGIPEEFHFPGDVVTENPGC